MNAIRQSVNTAINLLGSRYGTDEALVMLYAIGYQESRFKHRHQIGGPAHGYWQFEQGGGVRGVMRHRSSKDEARRVCMELNCPFVESVVYEALVDNTVLAAAFARLLLWTDPNPMPAIGHVSEAWDYYIRNWRPGKPHRDTWDTCYQRALLEVFS